MVSLPQWCGRPWGTSGITLVKKLVMYLQLPTRWRCDGHPHISFRSRFLVSKSLRLHSGSWATSGFLRGTGGFSLNSHQWWRADVSSMRAHWPDAAALLSIAKLCMSIRHEPLYSELGGSFFGERNHRLAPRSGWFRRSCPVQNKSTPVVTLHRQSRAHHLSPIDRPDWLQGWKQRGASSAKHTPLKPNSSWWGQAEVMGQINPICRIGIPRFGLHPNYWWRFASLPLLTTAGFNSKPVRETACVVHQRWVHREIERGEGESPSDLLPTPSV